MITAHVAKALPELKPFVPASSQQRIVHGDIQAAIPQGTSAADLAAFATEANLGSWMQHEGWTAGLRSTICSLQAATRHILLRKRVMSAITMFDMKSVLLSENPVAALWTASKDLGDVNPALAGITLPQYVGRQAAAEADKQNAFGKQLSCIR